MGMEPTPERPPPDGFVREIFDSSIAQNTQITVKKEIRDRLGILKGDILFVQILKVLSPEGELKYQWKGEKPSKEDTLANEEE
jgi:hypothetical protein